MSTEDNKGTLNVGYRPDVGSAKTVQFEAPAMPSGDATATPQTTIQDIRLTSPAPSEADLKTPNDELLTKTLPDKPSIPQVIGAAIAPTGRDWWGSAEDSMIYEADPLFQVKPLADEWFQQHGMLSETENTYINGSGSYAEFEHRTQKLLAKRDRDNMIAQRPYVGIAASIVDIDLATLAIPEIYGAAKVTKGTAILTRGAQAASGAGLAYGVNAALSPYSERSEDEQMMDSVTFGLVGMLTGVSRAQKGVTGTTLPPNVAAGLQSATAVVQRDIVPISRPVGEPIKWFKEHPVLGKITSAADELYYYTQGDQSTLVNRLLANVGTEGDNVASAQAAYMNNYGYLLSSVEKSLSDAVPQITGTRSNFYTRFSGEYGDAAQRVMDEFQDQMQKLDQAVLDIERATGSIPDMKQLNAMIDSLAVHDAMKGSMRTYVNSGFATRIYDDAKLTGMLSQDGMTDIVRRPTYMPLQHSYDRMNALVRDGEASWDDIYTFYGTQITRIYPELLDPNFAKAGRSYSSVKAGAKTATTGAYKLYVKQVGEHFVQTQRQNARGLSDVVTHGMSKEVMHDMLTRAGVNAQEASTAVQKIFADNVPKQGTVKNLRKRMSWDWNLKQTTSSGGTLDMGVLTGGSTYHNIEAYARRMAHLNGLAQYGLTHQGLQELLESYIDKAPRAVNPQRVRSFMQNVQDDLLGRPTGSEVPQSIRTAQAIADPMLLANSGLFGLVDLSTQIIRTGVLRSFPHMYRGLSTAIRGMKGMSKENAKDLEDILSGKLMQGSRWKNFMTHYSDNFSIEGGGLHEAAQYYGQSARFMNLSESVKRIQIGTLMGVYVKAMEGAAKGVAADLKFLKGKLRMSDDLVDEITREWNKHGAKVDDWDAATRVAMEQKIFHESDNLAYTIQKGETPAILEYSPVGKIIFPYMRFAFAMNQKVLRRVWNRDGAAGISLLLASQIPVAMLVASAINVRKGEDPEKDLALGTIRAISAMGAWNYPLELMMAGMSQNSVTALAPLSKTFNLVGDAISGDITPRSIKENTVLNSAVLLDPIILALEE